MAAEAGLQQAAHDFVASAFGSGIADCSCSVSIALSFKGDSVATAAPAMVSLSPGIAGRTGDAISVGLSADGPATAAASSGGLGSGRAIAVHYAPQPLAIAVGKQQLRDSTRALIKALIASTDQTPSGRAQLNGLDIDFPMAISAETNGAPSSCSADGSCAVAVAVAIGGSAHASIAAASPCSGSVGAATAIAIAVAADASSQSARGVGGSCPVTTSSTGSVSAVAGNTGTALGVSMASRGPAEADVRSGHLGAINTTADSALTAPVAVAASGSTGDAAGIAIGQEGASSSVRTGDSGHASASCARCSIKAGSSLATTGDTGSSYGLAGAGLAATVTASTGDSGNADARVTGSATPASSGNGAKVFGDSGDTGNAIAVAVDLSTWVTVTTHSGDAGAVISVATGAPGSHGATVGPSKPSHQSVHTGPPAQHPRAPALIAEVASARPLGLSSGALSSDTSSSGAVVPPPAASGRPAEPVVPVSPSVTDQSPSLRSSAVPVDLVPAAQREPLTRPVRLGRGISGVGLITLPFVLLAVVCLAAVLSHHRRRRRPY